MTLVIRIDEAVMEAIKAEAVRRDLVFGTPNEVLRQMFGVTNVAPTEVGIQPTAESLGPTGDGPLEILFEGFKSRFQEITGESLGFEMSSGGRWVSLLDNFVTVKLQPRKRDLAFTVYGFPHEFQHLTKLNVKKDRSHYSRFNVADEIEVDEAVKIAKHAQELSKSRKRRRATH